MNIHVSLANTLDLCGCTGECDCYDHTLEVRVNGRAGFGLAQWVYSPEDRAEGWCVVVHGKTFFNESCETLRERLQRHFTVLADSLTA